MLPTHHFASAPFETGFSFCLIKRPSIKKLIVRWITLACIVIALIWFGGPLLVDPYFKYPSPTHQSNLPPQPSKEQQAIIWDRRKNEVRDAFSHAWSGYKSMAYPNDELMSLSGGKSNKLRSPPFLFYHRTNPFRSIYLFILEKKKDIMDGA